MLKHKLGKLPLPENPDVFIMDQCRKHLIDRLPLDNNAVFYLKDLPDYHRDPFDRMLICQAMAHNLTLLTSDTTIMQYPVATVW